MRLVLQIVATLAALLAAEFWRRASQQPPPPNITWDGSIGQALEEWMRSSAVWNRWAARCTAVAVALQAASGFWR
jgi:hypothetical protein